MLKPLKKKIFAIGLASGALLTFFIVLAVYILYEPPRQYELPSLTEGSGSPVVGVTVYDFALPDEVGRFLSPRPWYFREPGRAWTGEDSREFWVDPRGLAADVLTRQNRKKIDDMFEKVP
ncbi:MAG: hypothetical protein LBT68_08115 [Spirochaetales bacterium]|jgi:hypothetical protein|nr:hypothetical protein [Spirochaetales bacterium]